MQRKKIMRVKFFFPGLMFTNTSTIDVEDFYLNKIEFPDKAFACSVAQVKIIIDDDGTKYESKPLTFKGKYYRAGATIIPYEKIPVTPENTVLRAYCEYNKWTHIVIIPGIDFPQPFFEGKDTLLPNIYSRRQP